MRISTVAVRIAFVLLLLLPSIASAGVVIFERALPSGPNVNADAPGNPAPDENRSNIKWAPATGTTIAGDDFQLPYDAVIDSITVWMVAENPATTDPGQELSEIRLFTGTDSQMSLTSSSYTFSSVTYNNGQGYWNPVREIYQPIFELTFQNLNWAVLSNTLYDFAVQGIGTDALLSLHASNGCEFDPMTGCGSTPGFSDSRQDGPDGAFLEFGAWEPDGPYELQSAWYAHPGLDHLWDKASDINVRLTAAAEIPEPSTVILVGLGLSAVIYARLRLRKAGRKGITGAGGP